jgi:predicted CoA-binding protein/GNAT superfamily N-acetyltransferase
MTGLAPGEPAFALLADGTAIKIRELGPGDVDAVRRLHRGMSPDNLYLRFFGRSPQIADEMSVRLCREPGPGHGALGAWLADRLAGVGNYEPTQGPGVAEIALAVADGMHHRGVGTLLLEYLVSLARSRGVREFRADTLAQNFAMLRVLSSAGIPVRRRIDNGVIEITMPLTPDGHYLDAVAERERHANVESLHHLLRPASVAVIGVGRRPESIGGAILRNVVSYGFAGPVYAVNPHAGDRLAGVPCFPSVAELPEPPDLAVITVPPDAAGQVAEDCGRRGARSLVMITSGVDGGELLATCHRHGMRLVGPNCFGIASTAVNLDATFATLLARPGAACHCSRSSRAGRPPTAGPRPPTRP